MDRAGPTFADPSLLVGWPWGQVGRDDDLNHVGIASLEAVELVERLRKRFPIQIEVGASQRG